MSGAITVLTHRTDLVQNGTMKNCAAEFNKIYPKVTVKFDGITDYEGEVKIRMNTDDYGDVLMIPNAIAKSPVSVDEAARLDGANALTIYWRIIFPLLKPAIATVVIIKGITVRLLHPVPLHALGGHGHYFYCVVPLQGPFGAHWKAISAGAILVILPTLIVFLFLQRYIYNGFARGATK